MSRSEKYQLWGWILFLICALFFIASSLQNGDRFALIASLVFFVACIVFMVPLLSKNR